MNSITSLQNPKIKAVVALQQKSAERRKQGLFVVEGLREVEHCLEAGYQLHSVYVCSSLLGSETFSTEANCYEVTPEVYEKIAMRLETGWETTIELLEQGKKEGVIRKDADIRIIKVMLEASIEKMISEDMLEKNNIKYVDALKEVVNILVDGIAVR